MAFKAREERSIAGERHLCIRKAAEFLDCGISKMRDIVKKASRGTLRPPLDIYRDTARSPIWISEEKLKEWAEKRGRMHA